jgi:type I restriction enzyme M protein
MVRESLRQRFVSALETLGGSAGNGKLQVELGWQDDTYWNVHAALIEEQTITKGRGRGGSVSLAAASDNAAQPSAAAVPPVLARQEPKASPPPLPARNTGRNGGSMFEQTFKNIDDVLWKEAGCTTELDYTEQTSWILFLKYLDDLEQSRAMEAELVGKPYTRIIGDEHRWSKWAAPRNADGSFDHDKRTDRRRPDRLCEPAALPLPAGVPAAGHRAGHHRIQDRRNLQRD